MTVGMDALSTLKEMKDDGRPWVLMRFLPLGHTLPSSVLKRESDLCRAQTIAEQAATIGAWRDNRIFYPGRAFADAMIVTLREIQCEAFIDLDVRYQACTILGIASWRS